MKWKEKWDNYPIRIIISACVACIAATVTVSSYVANNFVIHPIKEKNSELREKNEELEKKVAALLKDVERARLELLRSQRDLIEAKGKIISVSDKKIRTDQLENKITTLDSEIYQLSEQHYQVKEELDNYVRRLKTQKNDIVSYRKISELEPIVRRLEHDIKNKNRIRDELKSELKDLRK